MSNLTLIGLGKLSVFCWRSGNQVKSSVSLRFDSSICSRSDASPVNQHCNSGSRCRLHSCSKVEPIALMQKQEQSAVPPLHSQVEIHELDNKPFCVRRAEICP